MSQREKVIVTLEESVDTWRRSICYVYLGTNIIKESPTFMSVPFGVSIFVLWVHAHES